MRDAEQMSWRSLLERLCRFLGYKLLVVEARLSHTWVVAIEDPTKPGQCCMIVSQADTRSIPKVDGEYGKKKRDHTFYYPVFWGPECGSLEETCRLYLNALLGNIILHHIRHGDFIWKSAAAVKRTRVPIEFDPRAAGDIELMSMKLDLLGA